MGGWESWGGGQLAKGRVGAGAPKDKHQGRVKNEGGGEDGSQLEASATVPEEGSLEARGSHTALCSQTPVVPNLRLRFPPAPFCCSAYQPY